jgi:hypothetical protein
LGVGARRHYQEDHWPTADMVITNRVINLDDEVNDDDYLNL